MFSRSDLVHVPSHHIAKSGLLSQNSTAKYLTFALRFDESRPLFSVNFGRERLDLIRISKASCKYLPATTALARSCLVFLLGGTNEGQR